MNRIPNGWEMKRLGEVCELAYGKPLDKSLRNSNGIYPVYGANGIIDKSNQFYHNKKTIVIGRKGSAGEITISEKEFWPLDVTYFLTFDEKKHSLYFLYYLLKSLNLPLLSKGVKPGLNRNDVYSIKTYFPPLPEQQRIVSILDEAFFVIDKAKANAEKNLKNARELFDSYLNEIFEKRGEGWEESNIEDNIILIDYRGKTPKKTKKGVRLITAKNVKIGYLQLEPQEFIAEENYESWMTRGIPTLGDILFTTEAPLGNVAQIDTDEKLAFAQRIIIMKPNRKIIDPTFLKYQLISPSTRKKIMNNGTGATVIGIKSSLLKRIKIWYPRDISEQQIIVQQLDALRAETQKFESIYRKKLDDLEELRKSILHKTLKGEL